MYEGLIKFKDFPNRDLDYSSEQRVKGGEETKRSEANNTPVIPWRAQHNWETTAPLLSDSDRHRDDHVGVFVSRASRAKSDNERPGRGKNERANDRLIQWSRFHGGGGWREMLLKKFCMLKSPLRETGLRHRTIRGTSPPLFSDIRRPSDPFSPSLSSASTLPCRAGTLYLVAISVSICLPSDCTLSFSTWHRWKRNLMHSSIEPAVPPVRFSGRLCAS